MTEEENKKGVVVDHQHQSQPQPEYGTFQGVANYPPPLPPRPPQQPAIGFPRPVPPPGAGGPPPDPHYYARGYQTVPGTLDLSFSFFELVLIFLLVKERCFFVILLVWL